MRSALIYLIIFGCISAAISIECYDCESLSDPRCNQYFDPDGVKQTDCDDADMPIYLHKYERRIKATGCLTKVHEGVAGHRFYIRRSCYFGNPEDTVEACEAPDPYVPWTSLISCSVCMEDLCNVNALNEALTLSVWRKLTLIGLMFAVIIFNPIQALA